LGTSPEQRQSPSPFTGRGYQPGLFQVSSQTMQKSGYTNASLALLQPITTEFMPYPFIQSFQKAWPVPFSVDPTMRKHSLRRVENKNFVIEQRPYETFFDVYIAK
jgi:hypothetical protein